MLKQSGNNWKQAPTVIGLLLLGACNSLSMENTEMDSMVVEDRHLVAPPAVDSTDIPDVVRPLPLVSAPQPEVPLELYSVVVQDVPVRDLLFAMARDASINIDVHSSVNGVVSLNAIDQTLPQILQRIARQVEIRWAFERPDYLVVQPDVAEWRNYRVDYVNVARNSESAISVSSAVTGGLSEAGSAELNNSSTTMTQNTLNNFWETLLANMATLLGEGGDTESTISSSVIINPESGIVSVLATNVQHEGINAFLESVRTRSLYQVLIEATVVEVSLSDNYQSGVDWSLLARDNGQISFTQDLLGLNLSTPPTNVLTIDKSAGPDAISATIKMLSQFGDIQVLSSPKLMALNNQTAMLRVVDNRVYFTIEVQAGIAGTANSGPIPPTFTSEVHTVPVGFTMAVTPQISEDDQVTLNVRPTISRIIRFVDDPNPALAEAEVVNSIPEIQIREIESVLKVDSGQIAVLGGLMQDSLDNSTAGLPGLSRIPAVRNLFSYRDDKSSKSELIVFIRPVVIKQASVNADLQDYRDFLPASNSGATGQQSSGL